MSEHVLILYRGAAVSVVLFPDRAAVDRYIAERPDVLAGVWFWQVARVELQSAAVGAAAVELLAEYAK